MSKARQREWMKEYRKRKEGSRYNAGKKEEAVIPKTDDIPWYNPSKHREQIGKRVRLMRGNRIIEMVVPELDADGQPIGDF